jgi:hypothetical protein
MKFFLQKLVLFLMIMMFFGCNHEDKEALKNIHVAAFPKAMIDLRLNTITNDRQFSYNLTPDEGLVSQLSADEKMLLEESIQNLEKALEGRLGKSIKVVSDNDAVQSEVYYAPKDDHVFIPSRYSNLNLTNPETVASVCKVLGVDGVGSLRLTFFQNQQDRLFSGTFSTIKVRALIEVRVPSGEITLSKEIWGESKKEIKEDSVIDVLQKTEKATNMKRYYSFKSDFGPLFKEALDDLEKKMLTTI